MPLTTMSPDRRRLWLGASLLTSGGLLYLTLSAGGEAPVAAAAPTPIQAPVAAPPPSAPAAAAEPAPDLSQLRLHGLTATGGIIASGSSQRLVRLGREVLPGVTLERIKQHHAVLVTAAGRFELGFLGLAEAASTTIPGTAAGQPTGAPSPQSRREETLQYRFGLAPRRDGGRITGFAVRSGAEMPLLQRAGLRAGDILVAVNGQAFESEEKVMELASEIAGSYTAEFEFERNGQRMKTSLLVNPRA